MQYKTTFFRVFLGAFIFLITFSAPFITANVSLDLSYMFGINHFFANHMAWGKDVFFPYGPLGFLFKPLPIGNNLFLGLLFWILTYAGAIFLFMRAFFWQPEFSRKSIWDVISIMLLILLFNIIEPSFMLIFSAFTAALLYYREKTFYFFIIAIGIAAFAVMMKFSVGLLSYAFIFVPLIFPETSIRAISLRLVYAGVLSIFVIVTTWLLLYGTMEGFFMYFFSQLQFSMGYASAMSTVGINRWGILLTGLAIFFGGLYLVSEKEKRIMLFSMIFPSVMLFKYAFARCDHVVGFIDFFIYLSFIFLMSVRKPVRFILSALVLIVSLKLISMSFSLYTDWIVKIWTVETRLKQTLAVKGPREIQTKILHFKDEKNRRLEASRQNLSVLKFSSNKIDWSKHPTFDVFPHELNILYANDLNWKPRKTMQSYTTYTAWLDRENSRCISEKGAPDYLILHHMETIDSRYLLNDVPLTMYEVFNHYRAIDRQKFLIMERSNAPRLTSPRPVFKKVYGWEQWLDIPDHPEEAILRAKFTCHRTFYGKIKRALYKEGAFYISYELTNGHVITHRFIPDTAGNGLFISPYLRITATNAPPDRPVLSEQELYESQPVKRIKIASPSAECVTGNFSLEWEVIERVNLPHEAVY